MTGTTLVCPQCGEAAKRRAQPLPRTGWALDVEPRRLVHTHTDGSPLCPEVTATGYQPALPIR